MQSIIWSRQTNAASPLKRLIGWFELGHDTACLAKRWWVCDHSCSQCCQLYVLHGIACETITQRVGLCTLHWDGNLGPEIRLLFVWESVVLLLSERMLIRVSCVSYKMALLWFFPFSCQFLHSLLHLFTLTPTHCRTLPLTAAHSRSLPLTQAHSCTFWSMNINRRTTKSSYFLRGVPYSWGNMKLAYAWSCKIRNSSWRCISFIRLPNVSVTARANASICG